MNLVDRVGLEMSFCDAFSTDYRKLFILSAEVDMF